MAPLRWRERLEAILVARDSVLQRGLLALLRVAQPGVIVTRRALLDEFESPRRVSIVSPSDADPDVFRRLQTS
ncbi:MAG: hypothetical protein HYR51_18205 [Candidatus Rokubacteria bacterium]|nr:hypothetical protein [Candidatus Rokubacteria bacterium]